MEDGIQQQGQDEKTQLSKMSIKSTGSYVDSDDDKNQHVIEMHSSVS